jgi:hypothetical protein
MVGLVVRWFTIGVLVLLLWPVIVQANSLFDLQDRELMKEAISTS